MVSSDDCHDVLLGDGFEPIGTIDYNLRISLWWHARSRLQVTIISMDEWRVVQASKPYLLTAVGEDGELYARDLGPLEEYLTTHFPELHISMASFRDPTLNLVRRRIAETRPSHAKPTGNLSAEELRDRYDQVTEDADAARARLHRIDGLRRLNRGRATFLDRHLRSQVNVQRNHLQELVGEAKVVREQHAVQQQLEREYLTKASAICVLFVCGSNLHLAESDQTFRDALTSVTKEILDLHRYQVQQKLQGGKLHIYVEESPAPAVSLLTHTTRSLLNPRQLDRLGPELRSLAEAVEQHLMVMPREDIRVSGSVVDQRKLVTSRILQRFLGRLRKVPPATNRSTESPRSDMPVWIGNVVGSATGYGGPWELPLDKTVHIYVSGKPGVGKSFLVRVVVEGAALYQELAIVILDPRNQWLGLRCPEDRPEILAAYKSFGLSRSDARSFDFTYHRVDGDDAAPLPADVAKLAVGRHIISFKGMDDAGRCATSARIVEALFGKYNRSESPKPRLLMVYEEAQLFTTAGVPREARDEALRSELAIDRVVREGRKYGVNVLLLSQSALDLSRAAATIRQNITTRIFLHSSGREVEFAADFLPDGKQITELPRGQAFVCNPEWGAVRIAVRPPLSKVFEPEDKVTKSLAGAPHQAATSLSNAAGAVLELARKHYEQTGAHARLSWIAERLRISSRRELQRVVKELERASVARRESLRERGRPSVIIPLPGSGAPKARDERAQMRPKWAESETNA